MEIKCPECHEEIDLNSQSCDYCGHVFENTQLSKSRLSPKIVLIGCGSFLLLLVVVVVAFLYKEIVRIEPWQNVHSAGFKTIIREPATANTTREVTGENDPTKEISAIKETVDLNALIVVDTSHITIKNNDTFTWKNIRIILNPVFIGAVYKVKKESIEVNQAVEFLLNEFRENDGNAFNPKTETVNSVSIHCDTPQGKGYYLEEFNKKNESEEKR